MTFFSRFLVLIIFCYRYTISPFIGNSCRFYPTCSHYAETAIRTYGGKVGLSLAVRRLLKCHPWHDGGFDPVQ